MHYSVVVKQVVNKIVRRGVVVPNVVHKRVIPRPLLNLVADEVYKLHCTNTLRCCSVLYVDKSPALLGDQWRI